MLASPRNALTTLLFGYTVSENPGPGNGATQIIFGQKRFRVPKTATIAGCGKFGRPERKGNALAPIFVLHSDYGVYQGLRPDQAHHKKQLPATELTITAAPFYKNL